MSDNEDTQPNAPAEVAAGHPSGAGATAPADPGDPHSGAPLHNPMYIVTARGPELLHWPAQRWATAVYPATREAMEARLKAYLKETHAILWLDWDLGRPDSYEKAIRWMMDDFFVKMGIVPPSSEMPS